MQLRGHHHYMFILTVFFIGRPKLPNSSFLVTGESGGLGLFTVSVFGAGHLASPANLTVFRTRISVVSFAGFGTSMMCWWLRRTWLPLGVSKWTNVFRRTFPPLLQWSMYRRCDLECGLLVLGVSGVVLVRHAHHSLFSAFPSSFQIPHACCHGLWGCSGW